MSNVPFYELSPGDSIEFADITQIPAFENLVAEEIDPTMTPEEHEIWMGRVALKDVIRPLRFNGTIADIELVVMDTPHDLLMSARERGWKFLNHPSFSSRPYEVDDETASSYRGFTFLANAKSSGRGTIGQIQAELWYGRVGNVVTPSRKVLDNDQEAPAYIHKDVYKTGTSIKRYLTRPKLEKDAFIDLEKKSKKIGFGVLKENMMRPIIQNMRQ